MRRLAVKALCIGLAATLGSALHVGAADAGVGLERDIDVNGLTRKYCLYVPSGYQPGNPAVFHYHGGGGSCVIDRDIGRALQAKADKVGFLLVRPSGWDKTWNACSVPPETCATPEGGAENANIDDLAFFDALHKALVEEFGVGKTYVGGHSMGGMESYFLACHRSDVIAAASGTATTARSQSCPGGPVPFLHMHGRDDDRVPWPDGGRAALLPGNKLPWPSPLEGIEERARENGCDSATVHAVPVAGAESFTFEGCSAETAYWVVDCKHGWPGINRALAFWARCTETFRAEDVLWDFYRRH